MNNLGYSRRIKRSYNVIAYEVKPYQINSMDCFVVLFLAMTLCLLRLYW